MDRQTYLQNLHGLRLGSIDNPTPDDMAAVCPHLTRDEAVAAFNTGSHYVACPPLRVRNGFQIVSFSQAYSGPGTSRPPRLNWSYAGRVRDDLAYLHSARACAFAEEHWGDELVEDDWKSFVEIYLQDPSDLYEDHGRRFPRTKRVIGFTTSRDWSDIANDPSAPESRVINDALTQMTLDVLITHELKGPRGGYSQFSCAFCSAGLGLGGCNGCEHTFSDSEARSGWYTPLPTKLVELVQASGWTFKRDPAIAVAAERERWQRTCREAQLLARSRT